MKKSFLFMILLGFAGLIITDNEENQEIYPFDDFNKEVRFNVLVKDYRCPKCQSSNLAGSNAPIAKDLKLEIYKLIKLGKSDQEITNFLSQRYGDFILYEPPFNSATSILWVGPFFILIVILSFVSLFVFKKRRFASKKDNLYVKSKVDQQSELK